MYDVTGLKCMQVIYAIVSRTIRLPTITSGASFFLFSCITPNYILLLIISTHYNTVSLLVLVDKNHRIANCPMSQSHPKLRILYRYRYRVEVESSNPIWGPITLS